MNQTSAASPGGKGQLCVQTKSSQEATRNAPLVAIRQPAVVYPAMRPGFEIGSGGGHRSRRRAFHLLLPGSIGERSSPVLSNRKHFPRQWYSLPSIRPIWVLCPFVRYRASSRRCRSPIELSDLTITGIPGVSCSVASGRVAYCLGTASGPRASTASRLSVSSSRNRAPWCPSVGECHPRWAPSPGRPFTPARDALVAATRTASASDRLGSSRSASTSRGPCWSAWRASPSGRVGGAFYLNRTDPQSSSSFIRPGRQGDDESLGEGVSVGESLGEGVSVGEALGEGDDVSLAGGSVAVDVGAGGTAVVVGNGTGGVGRGSVAGGGSDPPFPAPVVDLVPITGA